MAHKALDYKYKSAPHELQLAGAVTDLLGVDMNHFTAADRRTKAWARYQAAAALHGIRERIQSSVSVTDSGCWTWKPGTTPYAIIGINGRSLLAHRLAALVYNGDFDPALDVDHLCRNTRCVNPEHLEAISHQENILRGARSALREVEAACSNGHTYITGSYFMYGSADRSNAYRVCRECAREAGSRYRVAHPKGKLVNACRNGHPYTNENTAVTHKGKRRCRDCYNEGYARRKAARSQ